MSKICEICIWLKLNNKDFVTEAEFIKGGRADILVLEDFVAIEVLKTETLKSFKINKTKYPVPVIAIGYNEKWCGL